MMKKAYVYIRVSSEEQVSNYSLENQEEYCRKEATSKGYEVVKVFREEGISAKTLNRPKIIALLEECRKNKKEISAMYIYKIDRISRDTFDFLAVKKKLGEYGIRILSVTEPTEDNPTGEFLETLLAASAKLDNATKGLRSRDGMRKHLEDGWANGKAPVGYVNVTREEKQIIEPDPEQFELVKKAWREMAIGAYSLEAIAVYMDKIGIKTKVGKREMPVLRQHAQRIFRSKFYCGWIVSDVFKVNVIGKHIPMIDEGTYYRVQAILDKRSFTGGIKYTKLNDSFPLRGHVTCGGCGNKLTGSFSKGRKNTYPYYYCLKCRPGKSIPKNDFEEQFLDFLREIKPIKEMVELFAEMVKEKWKDRYSYLEKRERDIKKDLEALKAVRKLIIEKNLKGTYSDDVYKEQMAIIEDEVLAKNIIMSESKLSVVDIDVVVEFMKNFLWNIDKAWLDANLMQRKALLGSIYPENLIYENGRFRTTKLGPCFEIMQSLSTLPISSWVADGT
ncbi:MAG: recombinase family protein [Patescibacteria group bacterium]